MKTLIAHASINENGRISGGVAGDQSGKEICIREWYSKPWSHVIRFKNPELRNRIALDMEYAANNNNIGYDQPKRNTVLPLAREVGYDLSKIKKKCSADCSSTVSVACMYAGIPEFYLYVNGNLATTRTLRKRLADTGKVDIFTDKSYTTSKRLLCRGDILLCEGKHVAVVIKSDNDVKEDSISQHYQEVAQIAFEVLQGKWGTGEERKQALSDAGYNYKEIQAAVNLALRGGK